MKEASRTMRWTYQDLLLLPEEDGKFYEILEGELFVSAAPIPKHQIASMNLSMAAGIFIGKNRLGGRLLCSPIDVVLAEDTVVQPDILYIAEERLGIIGEKCITAAPDWAVEILSSAGRRKDCVLKRKIYAAHGVREYWIVDPELERVEVHLLDGGELLKKAEVEKGEVASLSVLPGFRIPIEKIFA